jgi:hypothetical protein
MREKAQHMARRGERRTPDSKGDANLTGVALGSGGGHIFGGRSAKPETDE